MTEEIKVMVKNSSATWIEEAAEDIKGATITYVDGCDDLGLIYLIKYENKEVLNKVYEAINEVGEVQEDYAEVEVLEVQEENEKIEYDDGSVENIEYIGEVKLKVTHKDKEYYVNCYTLDVTEDGDSYVVRVYDSTEGMDITDINWLNKHEISWIDTDSTGSLYEGGLQLEDEVVEQAIMDVLFGDKGIIIQF